MTRLEEYGLAAAVVWGWLLLGVLVITLMIAAAMWIRDGVRWVFDRTPRGRRRQVEDVRRRYSEEAIRENLDRLGEHHRALLGPAPRELMPLFDVTTSSSTPQSTTTSWNSTPEAAAALGLHIDGEMVRIAGVQRGRRIDGKS